MELLSACTRKTAPKSILYCMKTLLIEWIKDSSSLAVSGGYANLHIWLGYLGLKNLILPVSFVSLAALGLWLYRNNNIDIWIQLGVAALVARLWTYHRLYDDLLIVVPMIAIFRIVKRKNSITTEVIIAEIILMVSFLGLLSPGYLFRLPPPWGAPFRAAQVVIWLSMLIYLIYYSYRNRK